VHTNPMEISSASSQWADPPGPPCWEYAEDTPSSTVQQTAANSQLWNSLPPPVRRSLACRKLQATSQLHLSYSQDFAVCAICKHYVLQAHYVLVLICLCKEVIFHRASFSLAAGTKRLSSAHEGTEPRSPPKGTNTCGCVATCPLRDRSAGSVTGRVRGDRPS
jgi:hypothetical protein